MAGASHRARLVLSVVATDATFVRAEARGEAVFVGRCLFCQAKLVVPLDGAAGAGVTVEHVVPRAHGGDDRPENLALACAACNGEKGRRHDSRLHDDPRRIEITRALLERRMQRWPASAPSPSWPDVEPRRHAQAAAGVSRGRERPGGDGADPHAAGLTVERLFVYPIKSARGVEVERARLTDLGLEHDRRFMVVDGEGRFVTQRELPRLALVAPEVTRDGLRVRAPEVAELHVATPQPGAAPLRVEVWGDACDALDVGDEAAAWLERALGRPLRLAYMPDDAARLVDAAYARRGERVSFADGFPLLVVGRASIDDLNARLDAPIGVERLRPNVVVAGGGPYDEDRWRELRVGGVALMLVKPCARCSLLTVDPATGQRDGDEPLRTLATYRRQRGKIAFGQNALAVGRGELRVGDRVVVAS